MVILQFGLILRFNDIRSHKENMVEIKLILT